MSFSFFGLFGQTNMKTMQPSAHRHRYPARISLMLKPQTLMLQ